MAFRIGILGGTFNPIHTGHLLMAEGILVEQKLDSILFIPCAIPPHKKPVRLVSAEHRLKMIKMAIKDSPSFSVSTIELDRGGKSYSVDTLKELCRIYGAPRANTSEARGTICCAPQRRHPNSALIPGLTPGAFHVSRWDKKKIKFFFIIGSDSYSEFPAWKDSKRLNELCDFVIVERPGYPIKKTKKKNIRLSKVPTLPISSTDIRKMVKKGRSVKFLVPEDVRKYLLKSKLYKK